MAPACSPADAVLSKALLLRTACITVANSGLSEWPIPIYNSSGFCANSLKAWERLGDGAPANTGPVSEGLSDLSTGLLNGLEVIGNASRVPMKDCISPLSEGIG